MQVLFVQWKIYSPFTSSPMINSDIALKKGLDYAIEAVKVFGFSSPLWKRGVGEILL